VRKKAEKKRNKIGTKSFLSWTSCFFLIPTIFYWVLEASSGPCALFLRLQPRQPAEERERSLGDRAPVQSSYPSRIALVTPDKEGDR
jgi:hypothetical protein